MNKKFILIILFVCVYAISYAPPLPPPSGGPGCWPPPCVPIDGGISLLVAAGALYGAKTLYDKKKQKSSL